MNPIRGLYKHLATGRLYFAHRVVMNANSKGKKPNFMVVYSQQLDSVLKGSTTHLPAGTTWARDYEDFNKKFRKLDQIDITRIENYLNDQNIYYNRDPFL